jgi:hypothetical protein
MLGLLAALHVLAPLSDSGYHFPQSPHDALWTAAFVECNDECREQLAAETKAPNQDGLADFREAALATVALRQDDTYVKTAARFKKLEAKAGLPDDLRAVVLNNRAVALAMTGDTKTALGLLEQACTLRPNDYKPYINIFRIQDGLLKDAVAADAALQKAINLGGAEAAAEAQREDKSINLWYTIAPVPSGPIAESYLASRDDGEISRQFWEDEAGQLFISDLPILASIVALLALLVTALGILRHRSRRCPRCGQEMALGDPGPHGDMGDSCRQCREFFVGGKMTYQAKVEHEARVSRWETVSRWMFRLGNIVLPGMGSAVRGSGFGLMVLLLFLLGISLVVAGAGPLPDIWHLSGLYDNGRATLGVVLIVLAALMSFGLLFLGDPGAPEFIKVGQKGAEASAGQPDTGIPE